MNKPIKSVMVDNPISASEDTTLGKLKSLMDDCWFSHIPIVNDNNQLIGIISKVDLLKAFLGTTHSHNQPSQKFLNINASEIMTKDVISLKDIADIKQAIDILIDKNFHSLPVVDNNNKLVGIVTTNDLLLELKNYV